ncbi:MAG: FIST C-terminal domain-containing protein [Candidatus Omnitrophica bacterium]|nr:FIST C-terminal domain-containing protein [Candidatus Omnitrophota bacterium]
MQFASAITQEKDAKVAVSALCEEVRKTLSQHPHLALLFVSPSYGADWEELGRMVRSSLGHPTLIGCSSSGVIGRDLELEFLPAMSLVAAFLPHVAIHPFVVSPIELEISMPGKRWTSSIGISTSDNPSFILIPEPFSCDAMKLLEDLNEDFRHRPVIGGLASGAVGSGENFLFFNDEVIHEGAVGVALTGDISLETIVSQGCRPIGERYVVTKAEENVLLELAGKSPIDLLGGLFTTLPLRDRLLAQHALFLGIVMDEMKSVFKRGDFLIRNIIGADPAAGALIVGDRLNVGQTVQFHLRDAKTSAEDLRSLLEEHASSFKTDPPAGMLLFSCQGRGQGFYGRPNHDIQMIRSVAGESAIAGFFCNGEIGPVGGRTYLHGYTSSLGIFRGKQKKEGGRT